MRSCCRFKDAAFSSFGARSITALYGHMLGRLLKKFEDAIAKAYSRGMKIGFDFASRIKFWF